MKAFMIGSLLLASLSTFADENCGQAPRLMKVRSDITAINSLLAPIGALLANSSDGRQLDDNDYVSEEFKSFISILDDSDSDLKNLGSSITDLTASALTECVGVNELFTSIQDFEELKIYTASYENVIQKFGEELELQVKQAAIVEKDIQTMTAGSLTEEQTSAFTSKYSGADLEVAVDHAKSALEDIQRSQQILNRVASKINGGVAKMTFTQIAEKVENAIENLYIAAEHSKN